MRPLASLLLCVLLAACGSSADENNAFGLLVSRFQTPEPSARFTAASNAGAPNLQVGFVAQNVSSTLVLEREDGAFQYWLSVDEVHIILEDGLVHGTRGLGEGLLASDVSETRSRLNTLSEGPTTRFHTYLTGNDEAVTRSYQCDIAKTREITIPVVGGEIATFLYRENCNSIDQQFENLYWIDPRTRQIVQSRQWLGPLVTDLSTRIVLQ